MWCGPQDDGIISIDVIIVKPFGGDLSCPVGGT
jgi:hypothetical protein